jgi:hypothetical protein
MKVAEVVSSTDTVVDSDGNKYVFHHTCVDRSGNVYTLAVKNDCVVVVSKWDTLYDLVWEFNLPILGIPTSIFCEDDAVVSLVTEITAIGTEIFSLVVVDAETGKLSVF